MSNTRLDPLKPLESGKHKGLSALSVAMIRADFMAIDLVYGSMSDGQREKFLEHLQCGLNNYLGTLYCLNSDHCIAK